MKFAMFFLFLFYSPLLAETKDAIEYDTVKIQISDSGMKPWLNFTDGAARITFNTAVHHQALFFTSDLDINPGYIKSWKWFPSEGKYLFTIDTTLKYHDGKPISAFDFEFVLIKAFITTLPTSNERIPLSFIKGIDELKPGTKFRTGMAKGIKVLNSKEIEVSLTSGHTRFLYELGGFLPALAPIEEFEDDLYTFKKLPIGCGPYKVVFSDPKSSMVRVEKQGQGKGPKVIEFYTHNKGWDNKVDLALGGGTSLMRKYSEGHPGEYTRIQGEIPNSIQMIIFNYQNEAVQDVNFRKAIKFAFNKSKEISGFYGYTPTDQIIPSFSYGFQKKSSLYNPEEAKRFFKMTSLEIQKKEHTIICHGTPGSKLGNYYEFIKESLEAIGMKVKFVMSEEISFAKGQKDIAMSLYGRFIDSNPLTSFAYYLPGTSLETLTPNPLYEETFKKAENSNSTEERSRLINELSKQIEDQAIAVPLHQRHPVYFISNRLKTVGIGQNAWAINVSNIELK